MGLGNPADAHRGDGYLYRSELGKYARYTQHDHRRPYRQFYPNLQRREGDFANSHHRVGKYNELDGLFGIGLHQGSGTVTTLNGVSTIAENAGVGTVTNLNGARNEADGISGTTTNLTGSYNLSQNLGAGTVNFINGSYNLALNNSSANITGLTGVYSAAYDQGSASSNIGFALGGIFYATKFSNSGSLGSATGVRATAGNGSSTTVPTATAVDAQIVDSSTGSITNSYGLSVTYNDSGGGTINNFKGVYVAPITSPTSSYYGVYVDGSTQSYFGGNVGIGTTNPAKALTIAGPASAELGLYSTFTFDPAFRNWGLVTSDVTYGDFSITQSDTMGGNPGLGNSSRIRRVYIATGGNVGIGTTSPGQKLSVAGTIESTSGGVKFPDGTVQTTASSSGAAAVGFKAYGSAQTLSSGSIATVINPTVAYDKSSNYDASTGVFTAPASGVYECVCRTDIETGVSNASFNTTYAGFVVTGGDAGTTTVSARSYCQYAPCTLVATDQINLSVNGTVACATYQSSGGSVNLSGDTRTAFSCYRLGP